MKKAFYESKQKWDYMGFYERFEQIIVLSLTFLIAVIIVVSLFQLGSEILDLLFFEDVNPLDHATFQRIFGMILTVMIALEFKHSLVKVVDRKNHIIRVKTVLLIALLALARKLIILDMTVTSAETLAAIGFSVLVLGVTYWLLKTRDQSDLTQHDVSEKLADDVKRKAIS